MDRAEHRRQTKEDEKLLAHGINPELRDPEAAAAMARQLHALLERAKLDKDIDPPVRHLRAKVAATLYDLRDIPVACKKGCSHCCNLWVSASAPEVLSIAKTLLRTGSFISIDKIRAAHLYTKEFEIDVRSQHPTPCPLLQDNACSIYEIRPKNCHFAVSPDAAICARSYHNLTTEKVPMPVMHMSARVAYSVAHGIALKHAQLPYRSYELNAALTRALEIDDSERAWLSGEDIFSDVLREPHDIFSERSTVWLYERAFG
jgi:Putative zinc- or iron-chelating domain